MALREEGGRKGNGAGKFRWGAHPSQTVLSSVASSGKTRGRWPFGKGVETGKAQGYPSWEASRTPTRRSTRRWGRARRGSLCTDTSRQKVRLNQTGDNQAHMRGRANTPRRVAGEKSDRKWIKTCKTACARAQKNQRTRQRGGAHPPERHQPPDQDSEHSRRPPRVPQVPYMQRVVVHGGLVGLHTRAQRDRHQKPRGFRVPLGLRRLRPARRGRGLRN